MFGGLAGTSHFGLHGHGSPISILNRLDTRTYSTDTQISEHVQNEPFPGCLSRT